jgi:hypothetical protein
MKPLICLAVLFGAGSLFATDYSSDNSRGGNFPPGSHVEVNVAAESVELASGYAAAFAQLSNNITLVVMREGQRETLPPVRSMKAVGAVLVVEVGRGARYVVNPKDIVVLTDDAGARPK